MCSLLKVLQGLLPMAWNSSLSAWHPKTWRVRSWPHPPAIIATILPSPWHGLFQQEQTIPSSPHQLCCAFSVEPTGPGALVLIPPLIFSPRPPESPFCPNMWSFLHPPLTWPLSFLGVLGTVSFFCLLFRPLKVEVPEAPVLEALLIFTHMTSCLDPSWFHGFNCHGYTSHPLTRYPTSSFLSERTQPHPFCSVAWAGGGCTGVLKNRSPRLYPRRAEQAPQPMIGCYRDTEAPPPCIQEGKLHGAVHAPESSCGIPRRWDQAAAM